jgi:hypothetical protein
MVQPDQSDNQKTCPHCHQPLSPGVKFCETCGSKIEPAPVCLICGAPLTPGVKFCETCGKSVASPAPVTATSMAEPVPAATEPPVQPLEPAIAEPPAEPEPAQEAPPSTDEAGFPDQKPEAEPPVEEQAKAEPAVPQPAAADGTGSSQKTLLIAGVVGLVVIAALAWFVILPMLAGVGSAGSENGVIPSGTSSALGSGTPVSGATTTSAVSFEPQPTQILPANLDVTYQVERSPITGLVTVTFAGGPGMNGISKTFIQVTRSDGQVVTKSWKPDRFGDSVTLQGSMMTDRVEVITNFYNGDSYRCIDQIFEYKKRV